MYVRVHRLHVPTHHQLETKASDKQTEYRIYNQIATQTRSRAHISEGTCSRAHASEAGGKSGKRQWNLMRRIIPPIHHGMNAKIFLSTMS